MLKLKIWAVPIQDQVQDLDLAFPRSRLQFFYLQSCSLRRGQCSLREDNPYLPDNEHFFNVNQGSNHRIFNALACTRVALLIFHQKTVVMVSGSQKGRMSECQENL